MVAAGLRWVGGFVFGVVKKKSVIDVGMVEYFVIGDSRKLKGMRSIIALDRRSSEMQTLCAFRWSSYLHPSKFRSYVKTSRENSYPNNRVIPHMEAQYRNCI